MPDEWGDFSHHRPVLLADGTRQILRPASALPPAALLAAAATTAERYFDLGYPGIAWKISEGTNYEDPTWRGAYATAVRRGKWFMGYHYLRNAASGAVQYDWFASRFLAGAGGRLRPGLDRMCCDSEDTATPARAAAATLEFTRRAVAQGSRVGAVYSGPWYSTPNRVRLDEQPDGWGIGWVSDYTVGQPDATIELSPGWARNRVWARQYTSTRPGLPGLPMGCDFNRTLTPWPGATQEEADMTPEEHGWLEDIHAQIGGAVGAGQTTFAGTVRATLGTVQAVVNLSRAQSSALGAAISKTETSVLAAVATLPTDHLSPADRAELASSVAGLLNEQGIHVDGEALLDALAARLTADPVHG